MTSIPAKKSLRKTLVSLIDGNEERIPLHADELIVVPSNTWHRFEDSKQLKVMTVTPQPTDHAVARPGT